MTDRDPLVFSNDDNSVSPTQEILNIRSNFPPRAPLGAQLEMAWLDGHADEDKNALELLAGIKRIEEITGRHNTI